MVSTQPSSSIEPPLRSDAQRNRKRLLAAAEKLFIARGATASLDDVARLAKVGIGTLYRRFPTREALLAAMCDDRLLAVAKNSEGREQSSDPVRALRSFVEELAAVTNVYSGLAASIGAVLRYPTNGCAATTSEGQRLLRHAQAIGRVRHDVLMDDLVCVVTAAATASADMGDAAARIAHLVGLFFEGIEAGSEKWCRRRAS